MKQVLYFGTQAEQAFAKRLFEATVRAKIRKVVPLQTRKNPQPFRGLVAT